MWYSCRIFNPLAQKNNAEFCLPANGKLFFFCWTFQNIPTQMIYCSHFRDWLWRVDVTQTPILVEHRFCSFWYKVDRERVTSHLLRVYYVQWMGQLFELKDEKLDVLFGWNRFANGCVSAIIVNRSKSIYVDTNFINALNLKYNVKVRLNFAASCPN